VLVGQCFTEQLVVDSEILERHPCLRDARRAARLEHVDRLAHIAPTNPALYRAAAQPLVFEGAQAREVAEPVDLAARVPAQLLRVLQPEGTAGRRIEMPRDHL